MFQQSNFQCDDPPNIFLFFWPKYSQSLFKASHVTRRPYLKHLSGIIVQLLSLCMGKHQILQNCSLSLRLNFIFKITNETSLKNVVSFAQIAL